ncbi:MAG TPA: T9SS type A sorting domain-containing protein, partial [Flavobacterium sp.]
LHFAFLLIGMTAFAQNQIPGRLDLTFQTGTGFEDMMDAVVVQPDGKIIVAGQGDTYQGVPFGRIIRLNADGTHDTSFTAPELLIYENYNELALQPDGKILAISRYTIDVNSTDLYTHFKRMNSDGSLDTTFNEGGTGVVETTTSRITEMVVQPDGKIIIAGQFQQYNGVNSKHIARLNADGTLDTTFSVGTGFNASVYALCLQPDGKVIVSGNFTSYNGAMANQFVRLNADGTKDTSFIPTSVLGASRIGVQSNGNIVITGGFSAVSGVARNRVAILNPNGTLVTEFGAPPGPTSASNDQILNFAIQPDDKIIITGWFTKWGGVTKRHIIRLSPNGFPDNTFDPFTGPNYMVWDIEAYPGDRYVIVGGFSEYDAQDNVSIARINGLANIQPPTGSTTQLKCGSGTLATLSVTGDGIKWYDAAEGGNLLPSTTVLVSGTTYYASQTSSGSESTVRLAVTVTVLPNVTPTFTQIDPICYGDPVIVMPTTSTNGVTGTWSPEFSNTISKTYHFTPDPGQCAAETTMIVLVYTPETPDFTQVAAICSGAALSALPTTSLEDISGSWSPALNNTATTTYTFTPDAGQCATTATMTITVNQGTIPTFTQVGAICSGATLSALPTTSNNGITGSWSPALNNTATTTYTFTPATAQCTNTATMTITVIPRENPSFTQVAPICTGATLSALPTTSMNAISGSWSPALNNTATTTYTFTPATGECANTATMTINVNSSVAPTFTQVGAICSGATLSALSTTSNNGITGSWSPALNNTATTTYTFTPTAGQCATTSTMTVTVNSNVTPTFTQVAAICSGATLSALPTASNNGITGSWSPALNNIATTTYTFTPSAGQCATTATMTVTVNSNVTPTFSQVAAICSGATLLALPTTSSNGITGSWSPALNNTATTTYTFTPTAGQCATTSTMTVTVNSNVTPTFSQLSAICSGSTLSALPSTSSNGITGSWSPALNNTATTTYTFTPAAGQCAMTATMTITVIPRENPTFTQIASICSGATLAALPNTSMNAINGSWSPALNNMATTTYTFMPAIGECANTATMTIIVNSNVTPTFSQVPAICSGATLSALPTTSGNGINGSWSPALNDTATTTYTFTPAAGQCATNATMTIEVSAVSAPTGDQNQVVNVEWGNVATVADLEAIGESMLWFASEAQALSGLTPLDESAILVNGSTYYAMQYINGCQSVSPLAVTVSVQLGLVEVAKSGWKAFPNPTENFVTISGDTEVESIAVFSVLGQLVSELKPYTSEVQVDLSGLPAAVYFIEVRSATAGNIYRVIKK